MLQGKWTTSQENNQSFLKVPRWGRSGVSNVTGFISLVYSVKGFLLSVIPDYCHTLKLHMLVLLFSELTDTFQKLQVLRDGSRTPQATAETMSAMGARPKHKFMSTKEQLSPETAVAETCESERWQNHLDSFAQQLASKKLKIQEEKRAKVQERKLKLSSKEDKGDWKAKIVETIAGVECTWRVGSSSTQAEFPQPNKDPVPRSRARRNTLLQKRKSVQQKTGNKLNHAATPTAECAPSLQLVDEPLSNCISVSVPEFDLKHSDLGEFGSDVTQVFAGGHHHDPQAWPLEETASSDSFILEDSEGNRTTYEVPFCLGEHQMTHILRPAKAPPWSASTVANRQSLQFGVEQIPAWKHRHNRAPTRPKPEGKGPAKSRSVEAFTWTPDCIGLQTLEEMKQQLGAAMKVLQVSMRSNAVKTARELHKEQMEKKNIVEVAAYVRTCIESGMVSLDPLLLWWSGKNFSEHLPWLLQLQTRMLISTNRNSYFDWYSLNCLLWLVQFATFSLISITRNFTLMGANIEPSQVVLLVWCCLVFLAECRRFLFDNVLQISPQDMESSPANHRCQCVQWFAPCMGSTGRSLCFANLQSPPPPAEKTDFEHCFSCPVHANLTACMVVWHSETCLGQASKGEENLWPDGPGRHQAKFSVSCGPVGVSGQAARLFWAPCGTGPQPHQRRGKSWWLLMHLVLKKRDHFVHW